MGAAHADEANIRVISNIKNRYYADRTPTHRYEVTQPHDRGNGFSPMIIPLGFARRTKLLIELFPVGDIAQFDIYIIIRRNSELLFIRVYGRRQHFGLHIDRR